MPHWVPGSTHRIAQLTGDYDPEFKTHFATSSRWGVEGVDLGATTEHDGKTFIFFGDVPTSSPTSPPHNSDLVAFIEDTPFPRGGNLAVARQSEHQLDVFFIGADGALYVSWVIDGGTWQGPVRISRPGVAPPGAGVTAAKQSGDQLDVFFIGHDGALYVSWVVGGGIWQGPRRLSGRDAAPPGRHVAAARHGSQQLNVLYIGNDQKLNVHRVDGLGDWQAPISLGAGAVAPPGGALTAIEQVPNQLTVLFIGHDQKLNVHWLVGDGGWDGPVSLGDHPVAPAGGHLAAIKQLPNQTSVLFIGNDRKLNVQWVEGKDKWKGPVALSPQPVAPSGAGIAVITQISNQTTALFVGERGQLLVQWVIGRDDWQGPHAISPVDVAPAGAPIVAAKQLPSLTTAVYGGPAEQLQVSWVSAGGKWQGPARINPDMVKVTPVLNNGVFNPFTLREGARTWMLLGEETPTGAFSYDGKAFVFVVANEGVTVSSLTMSCCPGEPVPFDLVFKFSFASDQDGGKFFQISPCVVRTEDVPELDVGGAEGAILFGQGYTRREPMFGVHLAWLPLTAGRAPDLQSIRYFTGNGPHAWSAREGDAVPLFNTVFGWASMSVGRVPGANLWILLYHTAGSIDDNKMMPAADRPIMARLASRPWEIGNAPEVPILDPVRDQALGRYMFRPNLPDPNNLAVRGVPLIEHPSFLYGPHLLNRYTRFDQATKKITIFYLVSTGKPYQVQLMESSIQLDSGSDFTKHTIPANIQPSSSSTT